jgi:hypothetical protein
MSAKLRLVKIAVQPFFILDDGETITELEHPATVIPASEWPTYSSERFPREVAEWQAKIDAEAAETITVRSDFGRPDPAGIVYDELPRDEHGNHGTDQGNRNTIIETP